MDSMGEEYYILPWILMNLCLLASGVSKDRLTLRSGWRRSSLSGLLTVKGTGMREQGSLKGVGTHRGNLCVDAQIVPNPDVRIYSFIKGL